ncbi:hypothetical protein ACIQGZ_15100 [Streptomyces sp. NPDC092296]|uniref:hypothetical protein n=1 Tax=Streptomyces sp. NPDC092296 TaxID=3366012 RepID=UPI00380B63C6
MVQTVIAVYALLRMVASSHRLWTRGVHNRWDVLVAVGLSVGFAAMLLVAGRDARGWLRRRRERRSPGSVPESS